MRYFFITQDVSLPCAISYRDFDITGGSHLFTKEDAGRLNDTVSLYLSGNGKETAWDFIQHPVTMFSQRFEDIIEAYEPGVIFKDVVLIHKENALQYRYVQTLMDQLDAAADQTEYYPNGMVKRMVLSQKKIGRHHLFVLSGKHRKDPVVSLALAESLLRRKPVGLCFEEVEVEDLWER